MVDPVAQPLVAPQIVAPQLVVNSRMVHFGWLPADPDAVAALVPAGLTPLPNRQVFMNQYVVDDDAQSSAFGAYSVTYLGVDLARIAGTGSDRGGVHPAAVDVTAGDRSDRGFPDRWWTHYLSSSPHTRVYLAARGVPVEAGRTTVEIDGTDLVATTETTDGVPLIRTVARASRSTEKVDRGQMRYLSRIDGRTIMGSYPYVSELATFFEVESLEFLEPTHPVYPLRPANPLVTLWGCYSPNSSFAYPGGETVLG